MAPAAPHAGQLERAHARRFSGLPRPTLRGVVFFLAAIVLFVLARVFLIRELAFVASLLLVVPVLGFVLVGIRRLQLTVVRRTDPETIEAGTPARISLHVTNTAGIASPPARWADPVDGVSLAGSRSSLPPIRAYRRTVDETAQTVEVGYVMTSPVRGVHTFGPVQIATTDPFGVAAHLVTFGREERITVTPRVWSTGRSATELAPGIGNDKYAGRLTQAGEVDVLARKYQSGDSMRRVNWPATARYGELMVRQDDQNGARDAIIVLDTDPHSYPGTDAALTTQDDLEWAVSAACSIGVAALSEGYSVGLATMFDDASDSRSLRIYAGDEVSRLLIDAASIRRMPSESRDGDLEGMLASAYGGQGGPAVFAVLGSRSRASLVRDLTRWGGRTLCLIVVPERADLPAQPALDLDHELAESGWSVRLTVASESFEDVWRGLVTGREGM